MRSRPRSATAFQRVYLKLLDIDWNPANGAHPTSSVRVPYQWRDYSGRGGMWTGQVELVPCIYITNNTFLKISDAEVEELGHNLLRKLRMECPHTIHGVMLDCDWTAKTKDRFFRLTRMLNDSLDVPLTATIRLHQYARPGKTGVPPADRGMLMPYNVGRITEPGNTNSIFDRAVAEPYFANAKPYPLPLDIGLPAFSWGVHFRNGVFQGILQDGEVQLAHSYGLLQGEMRGTLQVVNENNAQLPQLHLGDEIRMERMTPEAIAEVAQLARKAVNSDTLAVAYFELGTGTFQRMDKAEVQAGYAAFGRLCTSAFAPPEVEEQDAWEGPYEVMDTTVWEAVDTVMAVPEINYDRNHKP
jgi:hypothetical protein